MQSRVALLLAAALALLLALAGQAQASGGYKHGLNADGTKKNWLPPGVTADQVAAIRLTFPDGKVVDKPYPPPARAAGDKKWGGGGHHGAGADGSKKKWGDASLRPTKALVLKSGQVIPLPKPDWNKDHKPAFNKADVVAVTATFADGTTKALPLPGSGAPKQPPPAGAPRPTSITIELKNGTKITKNPPQKP